MISLKEIKKALDKSENPLIFFDDDPDGLCSYMLFMKYLKKGNGIIVKKSPTLDETYVVKVRQYAPDVILILDKPIVSQEFIDKMNVPVYWIDHHPIVDVKGVNYFNPRFENDSDNRPTTYWSYQCVKGEKWIALLGITSDWSLESFDKLKKDYDDLFEDVKVKNPDDVIFDTKFGKLIHIVSFNLKGMVNDTYNFIELFMKVKSPYEVLNKETEIGEKIYAKYEKVYKVYSKYLEEAMKLKDEEVIVYTYGDNKWSFSRDLANELLHRTKCRLLIIGRYDNGEVKGSIGNRIDGINLTNAVKRSLKGLDGYGGGHVHACGFCVKERDFKKFTDRLRKAV